MIINLAYMESNISYKPGDTFTGANTFKVKASNIQGFFDNEYHIRIYDDNMHVLDRDQLFESVKEFKEFVLFDGCNLNAGYSHPVFIIDDIAAIIDDSTNPGGYAQNSIEWFDIDRLPKICYPVRWSRLSY